MLSFIQNPYPVTHWCLTPPEDKTNKPLCRPLPNAVMPPPPVVRVVPPGTSFVALYDLS